MALREKEAPRKVPMTPSRLGQFFRRYRMMILFAGALLIAISVATAIKEGLRRANDQKASVLFSRARTLEDYRAILVQYPGSYLSFVARMNMGNLLVAQDKDEALEAATKQFGQALECSRPGFERASALCALGTVSAQQKQFAKACEYFGRAIAEEPRGVKAPEALHLWGRCLAASGDKAGAKGKFLDVSKEFPTSPWARDETE